MTTPWRRFTASVTLAFLGDIPPRRKWKVIGWAAAFTLLVFAPAVGYWAWIEEARRARRAASRSPLSFFDAMYLIQLPWLIAMIVCVGQSSSTAGMLREKGYGARSGKVDGVWKTARISAARMGNRRTRHELLRALPSRDELEVTPLYREGDLEASLSEAVRLLARSTQRYAIHRRGEARRAKRRA